MRLTSLLLRTLLEAAWLPLVVLAALVARAVPRRFDVGLGPQPLINNIYHKRALALAGYSAETFVSHVWHITADFDVRFDTTVLGRSGQLRRLVLAPWIFAWSAARYRCLVVYFD